jgi:hypothetical protein
MKRIEKHAALEYNLKTTHLITTTIVKLIQSYELEILCPDIR